MREVDVEDEEHFEGVVEGDPDIERRINILRSEGGNGGARRMDQETSHLQAWTNANTCIQSCASAACISDLRAWRAGASCVM